MFFLFLKSTHKHLQFDLHVRSLDQNLIHSPFILIIITSKKYKLLWKDYYNRREEEESKGRTCSRVFGLLRAGFFWLQMEQRRPTALFGFPFASPFSMARNLGFRSGTGGRKKKYTVGGIRLRSKGSILQDPAETAKSDAGRYQRKNKPLGIHKFCFFFFKAKMRGSEHSFMNRRKKSVLLIHHWYPRMTIRRISA